MRTFTILLLRSIGPLGGPHDPPQFSEACVLATIRAETAQAAAARLGIGSVEKCEPSDDPCNAWPFKHFPFGGEVWQRRTNKPKELLAKLAEAGVTGPVGAMERTNNNRPIEPWQDYYCLIGEAPSLT